MTYPPKKLQEKFQTNYNDASAFAANARLLQSIYRIEKELPISKRLINIKGKEQLRIFGNYIDYQYGKETLANFISYNIKSVVKLEMEENRKRNGKEIKQIKEKRLYSNLLSSQPLAFNLFGELSLDIALADKVFQPLFKVRPINIESIEFEISPGRGNCKYTCDHSAFDVFVKYNSGKGKGFIGIEVKYSEALKDKPARFKDRYLEIAKLTGIFTSSGLVKLKQMPISLEQIWRDHLLALSMMPPVNSDYKEGFFIYLYPKDNTECQVAIERYSKLLKSNNIRIVKFFPITMDEFVNIIKDNTNSQWIKDFEDRYLAFNKIKRYS